MSRPPPPLEEPYRGAALSPGSARYLAWLFAAAPMRDPLLGTFALMSEWRALADPATEPAVAHLKLGWWLEEIERLAAARPVHPISRFLAALPGAPAADFAALQGTLGALHEELTGTPLETAADFERRALALRAVPLRLAGVLAGDGPGGIHTRDGAVDAALDRALAALAYGSEVGATLEAWRRGRRVRLPLAELRAVGVAPEALAQDPRAVRLQPYLAPLRAEAARRLERVAPALPATHRAGQRHLAVLAALERRRLYADGPASRWAALGDLWSAWRAARRSRP